MDVAVLGATGDVGRQVCTQLIAQGVLPPTSRLQLVGRPGGASASAVHGLRTDLVDAFDEHAPLLDVALSPADVVADVVVVAAGATAPARVGADGDRAALAAANLAVFETYADALARHGSGKEVVVVVSNPVELGVAVLARRLGRHRVVGMGAWLDTLRFRREVALSLGVRRHRVGGFVGGQHGLHAVPLWSTVRIAGLDAAETRQAVVALRRGRTLDTFAAEVERAQAELAAVAARDVGEAFALVDTWPPDLRVVARPFMTHQSGAKTAAGTAGATAHLVETLLDGREIVVAGQVELDGEVAGLPGLPDVVAHGVRGVPVVLGPEGWTRVLLDPPAPDEARLLAASAGVVDGMLTGLGLPARAAGTTPGGPAAPPPVVDVSPAPRPWLLVADVAGPGHVGTVAALTSVFATRGVVVDSLATRTDVAAGRPEAGEPAPGRLDVTFRTGERRARALARAVERLAVVRDVTLTPLGHEPASSSAAEGGDAAG